MKMRLIEADELRNRFQNLSYDDWNQGISTSWAEAYSEFADMIDDMPTVEAEPVRHGHWKKLYTNNYKCSVCGSWWTDNGDTYLIEFNYCPNCGAKMDEVDE